MCLPVCPSPGSLNPHTGTCVSPGSVCLCVCAGVCVQQAHMHVCAPVLLFATHLLPPAHPCLSAALMTLAQRKVMTNARYQRTRPMTNGRAPEQPHYAVITEDGWPSAPPPPPHPYPPSPVTGADPAPPAREGVERPAGPPITRGREAQAQAARAGSPRGCLRRRNKAAHSAEASGARGVRPARGQDTQLCTHMVCTRASRLRPCTVHLQLLSRHKGTADLKIRPLRALGSRGWGRVPGL